MKSAEIHAAFPEVKTITAFMNKAKDHPDYCSGRNAPGHRIPTQEDIEIVTHLRKENWTLQAIKEHVGLPLSAVNTILEQNGVHNPQKRGRIPGPGKRRLKAIELARKVYSEPSNGEIEIDAEPKTLHGKGGIWVQAWVFVPNEEIDMLGGME
jgi:hypothetical protein